MLRPAAPVEAVSARAYAIPTDVSEADGTFAWSGTTLVLAEGRGGGATGLGCSCTTPAAVGLVAGPLAKAVAGTDAMDPSAAALFVDANGAYPRKHAVHLAAVFAAEAGASWFEEPVSSDDLPGLRFVREHAPPFMEVAAGEYAFTPDDVRVTLEAGAVDVQQVDATRCGGVTGFLAAAALCDAFHTPLSAHCGPALHLHVACAVPGFRHIEWFHDHARIEAMLFDGAPAPAGGVIRPDLSRPGLGLELKRASAERFAVEG